jgi:hypothetical protein
VQDVAERSHLKSEMLQGYGDAVLRAEMLENQLLKSRKHAAACSQSGIPPSLSTIMTSRRCRRRATTLCVSGTALEVPLNNGEILT